MKKIFSLIFWGILSAGFILAQNQVNLSGKVNNAAGKNVTFFYFENLLASQPVFYQAEISENGAFSVSFELEKARPITLRHGRESATMYVYPGDNINISLNAKEFDESLKYAGDGMGPVASSFLAAQFLKFENVLSNEDGQSIMKTMTAEEFLGTMEIMKNEKEDFFKEYSKEHKLSKDFAQYYNTSESYKWANQLMNYKSYHAYYNELDESEVEMPDDYYLFFEKIKVMNEEAVTWGEYATFLNNFLDYKTYIKTDGRSDEGGISTMFTYNLANQFVMGEPLTLVQAMILKNELEYGNPLDVQDAYATFMGMYENTEYGEILAPIYEQAMRLAPGQKAPPIELVDINGAKVELSDFRGQVVYLDFWASWCGPCRAEMPSARKLKKDFAGQDVVFLYVSIDDSEDAWRKAVEEENLKGVLLYSEGFRSEVPQSYGIKAIPNYFLINRDGTIALSNPDRPSGKNVRQQIEKALSATNR